jgi:cell division transport system permease protein
LKTSISVKKRKLGSYPYLSVIFSISIALFIIGLLGLLVLHSQKLTQLIKENIEIQIYLKKEVSKSEISQIRNSLIQADFISKKNNGKPKIVFVSKNQAAKKFIAETGENFVTFLGENPLRDAFTINISQNFQTELKMKSIKKHILKLPGIFEVIYVNNLIDIINKNIKNISLILAGFATILIIIVIVLIDNTIKLALFTQRFLIRSMQLVGATNGFIRRPFIFRSIAHGILSSLIASAALLGVSEYAYVKIEDLILLKNTSHLYILFCILLILGAFLGFFSSLRSVNKYLKLSLDELY